VLGQRGQVQERGAEVDRDHAVEELGGHLADAGDVGVAGVEPQPVQTRLGPGDVCRKRGTGAGIGCVVVPPLTRGIADLADSRRSGLVPVIITCASSSANLWAPARPMPFEPPLIRTRLPLKRAIA